MRSGPGDIVARCLAGDARAPKELYDLFLPIVYRLAVRLVGQTDASDVTQQVFLKVFKGLKAFRKEATFSTWLFRIAVNECLQHRRRCRRPLQALPNEVQDQGPAFDRRVEQAELLQKALDSLEEQLRTVFLLREVEELTYNQIAEVLGVPPGTVASQLYRARAELRKFLTRVFTE